MVYKPVKRKMTNLKNRPPIYSATKSWKIDVINEKGKKVKENVYPSLTALVKDNTKYQEYTLRNIAYGRVPEKRKDGSVVKIKKVSKM